MKSMSRRQLATTALFFLVVVSAGLCFLRLKQNPPGFYIDESSIAYNAWTIASTGADEHGLAWPLYFRAFGDYKNPVFIYLLAAIFRVTGPGILVARALSATAVVLAAGVLGWLAFRLTRSRRTALLITATALLTPWLFELGRVVIEVALYPLVLALFLLLVQRASTKPRWGTLEVVSLAAALALLTYTYSIGRVLAPLLAAGLILFWTRERRSQVVLTWCGYAITLIPIALFALRNPSALTDRFRLITYLTPDLSLGAGVWQFVRHYVRNVNPWRLLITGDPNRDQIVHVFGSYQFLAATFVLSVVGLIVVVRTQLRDPWWRFVLYGCVVALVPASLTNSHFHMLRLVAVPVFLLVVAIPGMAWFNERANSRGLTVALVVLIGLTLAQGALFQWRYHQTRTSERRIHLFDGEYHKKIFRPAIASSANPIYLADALWIPGYIQVYWYATLDGVGLERFHRLPPFEAPPIGALVISTEENCPGCDVLATTRLYTLYIARERRPRSPLPTEALRAEVAVISPAKKVRADRPAVFRVKVKNLSSATWLARERGGGSYQVALGNHWLDSSGNMVVHDDGRSALLRDLKPGETTELSLTVNAPRKPGDYLLEIDMLQENVSWFALLGSQAVRLPIRVE
ncbi:MAG TPA: glycosyltransferase family 39 protein [Chthoniobacterales bacterium]|nr:glycosyltransferase family 39 protein [Chthoniobacterales bacterium]